MVSVGDFSPEHCTATDEDGVIRVCDPRAWLLWLWTATHGKAYRTHVLGFEAWDPRDGDAYRYFSVKYAPMIGVEK